MPNARVQVFNKCTGDTEVLITDADGNVEYCVECGCDYEVIADKERFAASSKTLAFAKGDCPKQGDKADLSLSFGKENGTTKSMTLKEGATIELRSVYYDYDKSYIRDDARPELDRLVELMLAFPEMEIELASHTDSRASDAYNLKLSQARADAAADYLIMKGVPAWRIKAVGYGERQPRNKCRDNAKCTEEEFQFNRRTEIRITKFPAKAVQINYATPENDQPKFISRKP
jgi:outer membrane protein OmpA-like peptidoglycan-associated protein